MGFLSPTPGVIPAGPAPGNGCPVNRAGQKPAKSKPHPQAPCRAPSPRRTPESPAPTLPHKMTHPSKSEAWDWGSGARRFPTPHSWNSWAEPRRNPAREGDAARPRASPSTPPGEPLEDGQRAPAWGWGNELARSDSPAPASKCIPQGQPGSHSVGYPGRAFPRQALIGERDDC